MGLADARAMHPGLDIVEEEPEANRRLLAALADWCDRYTPLVALDAGDGLFLDIAGCAHLFGGEEAMRDDLMRRLAAQGFDARTGLAPSPGMAWTAARFGLPPIEVGGEETALAPLPLAALRLDARTRSGLESVGLRTVGALLCLPRAPLARRFGRQLMLRLDQALGAVEEPVSPRLPVAPLSAERHLPEPIVMVEDIERLLLLLATSLKGDLERRGEGARRLELSLFRVDGVVNRIAVGTSRPLRAPLLVARLFREKLASLEGSIDAGYGFDLVRLAVLAAAHLDETQGDLADANSQDDEELALFVDRVRARLGDQAVLKPAAVESHVPERAVALVPFAETGQLPAPATLFAGMERPLRLFRQPEPVEVTAEIPEGPPASFRWRRMRHRVDAAEGPERIGPEWWRQAMPEVEKRDEQGEVRSESEMERLCREALAKQTASLTRDYYRVEDQDGRRYWLYREGFYTEAAAPPKWFVQGLFA